jgi:23S rRNA (adenine2503-C2)-methyltransferase
MPLISDSITDLASARIDDLVTSLGEPLYRAGQIKRWVYQGLVSSFDEMTNLPAELRHKLMQETRLRSLEIVKQTTGSDGTVKSLLKCFDGKLIETALMYYGGIIKKDGQYVSLPRQAAGSGALFAPPGSRDLSGI